MRVERDLSSTLLPHSMGGIEVSFASGSVLKNRLSIGSFDGFRKYTFIPGGHLDESVRKSKNPVLLPAHPFAIFEERGGEESKIDETSKRKRMTRWMDDEEGNSVGNDRPSFEKWRKKRGVCVIFHRYRFSGCGLGLESACLFFFPS